ncbi:DUF4012 domain-containing protein [Nucisporomicrobium flavum]|uniref:DUF4012 domain-containing protein n=1 Tax=Nucisporomicrobium flavum TaxID=2785915 RepID=UPI0018F3BF3D|nr:DUF4012 domain-containing protein [Nucisporomicrobium flavum]
MTAAGLVVVLALGVGWVGIQGVRAKGHLQTAAGLFVQMQQQIRAGEVSAAKGTLAALQLETKAARDETDGFGWSIAGKTPLLGDDLTAVRTVAKVLDDLAVDGLPALLDVASGLDPKVLAPRDGRVDLASLSTAAPKIASGLTVIKHARAEVDGIDSDGLMDQVGAAVGQLSDGLAKADQLVSTADRAARLLPRMLGAQGPRNYLVLFQNNAEIRATGGMPGAYIVVHADGGAVTITDQGTAASDLKVFDPPVQQLEPDLTALYTDRPAVFPADVNLTPDFPTAAGLMRAMYRKRSGVTVDGVLATDPVALSYLLKATGAVKMPEGEPLTADNAVRVLLSEAYAKYPNPADQDKYFAKAARATFEALIKGQGDAKGMVTQLARAAGERRLLMWSADQAEETALTGTVLEGRLPTDQASRPTVGVFLNDGTGAKLDYYLSHAAELSVGDCDEEGGREFHLKLTLGSTAPTANLPDYVTGLALTGDKYTSRTNVMIFSPTGGGVVEATSDGKEVPFGTGLERDRVVAVFTVELPPGTTKTYDVTIQPGAAPEDGDAVRPELWTTPGVRPWQASVQPGVACS